MDARRFEPHQTTHQFGHIDCKIGYVGTTSPQVTFASAPQPQPRRDKPPAFQCPTTNIQQVKHAEFEEVSALSGGTTAHFFKVLFVILELLPVPLTSCGLCPSPSPAVDYCSPTTHFEQVKHAEFEEVSEHFPAVGQALLTILENATVRGRAWYKLLDAPVLTLDVTGEARGVRRGVGALSGGGAGAPRHAQKGVCAP